MTRVEYDIEMSYTEEGDFDWETFQYLCDCAEYWNTED